MKRETITILLSMLAVLSGSPAVTAETSHPPADFDLKANLEPVSSQDSNRFADLQNDLPLPVARFYQKLGYLPVWTGPEGLLPQGEMLLQVMANTSEAGFFPDEYRLPILETALISGAYCSDEKPPLALAPYVHRDIVLTHRILQYARNLSQGRIPPETMSDDWLAQRQSRARDIPAELAQAVIDHRLNAYIESLHPGGEAYQGLRQALQQYKRIKSSGGWPTIPPGPTLGRGDRSPRVEALRHRLQITGDGSGEEPIDPLVFDDTVQAAVKHFQHRHGLKEDGLAGKRTLAELNLPVEKRMTQMQLNMERWRWFPDSFGDRYLLVNIPAFELRVIDANARIDGMRVIVGKKGRPTPIMSGRMTYLEFNPYWNIPQEIARKDILPKAINDPTYLTRQGIRIFDSWDRQAEALDPRDIAWHALSQRYFPYRLRQDPSDLNALGQIKFMFPNPLSIYIHDTPGRTLFDRQERIFSSGCVRVEEPITLAQYLLNGQGWDHNRLKSAISLGQRKTVILDNPIPVYLVYFTAWTDADETVHFREDIYGRDERLLLALKHPVPELMVYDDTADHHSGLWTVLATEATQPLSTTVASRQNDRDPPSDSTGSVADESMTGI